MSRTASHTGYTLIELLIYVSIIGSLLTAASLYFSTLITARVKNQSIVEVSQQGTLVMDAITQTIRKATSITSPTAGNSGTSLTLVVPSGVESPTVFDLSGGSTGTLRIKEGLASAVALTNGKVQITSISFTNLSRASTPGVVRVSLTIERINTANRNEYSYSKTFTASAALRRP